MNKTVYISIGLIVAVGIGYVLFNGNTSVRQDSSGVSEVSNMVNKERDQKESADKAVVGTQPMEQKNGMMGVGAYLPYAPEKLAMAETGDVILFFHASWCPSCRALNSDIEKNLAKIPGGVTILKTDYDRETELKKKYGVTTQHTLVQVDKNGALLKKWSGGASLELLLSEIQ